MADMFTLSDGNLGNTEHDLSFDEYLRWDSALCSLYRPSAPRTELAQLVFKPWRLGATTRQSVTLPFYCRGHGGHRGHGNHMGRGFFREDDFAVDPT